MTKSIEAYKNRAIEIQIMDARDEDEGVRLMFRARTSVLDLDSTSDRLALKNTINVLTKILEEANACEPKRP